MCIKLKINVSILMMLITIMSSMIKTSVNTFHSSMRFCWTFGKLYLFWVILHMVSIELYKYYCTPRFDYTWENLTWSKIGDLILTPLYIQTPQCRVLYWAFNMSVNTINHFILAFVTWTLRYAIGPFKGVDKLD